VVRERRCRPRACFLVSTTAPVAGPTPRGLVRIDIISRIYRLTEHGHNMPTFIIPAFDTHPPTAGTRNIETQPTIVACLEPKLPTRSTELEKSYQERLDKYIQAQVEVERLRTELRDVQEQVQTLSQHNEMLENQVNGAIESVGKDVNELGQMVAKPKKELARAKAEVQHAKKGRDRAVEEKADMRELLEEEEGRGSQRLRTQAFFILKRGRGEG